MCFQNAAYGQFLEANGEQPVTWRRASTMDEVLREADLVRVVMFGAYRVLSCKIDIV